MIIKAIVDRIEGEKAILKTGDGDSIIWPIEKLPKGIKESAALSLEINTDEDYANKQKKLAKEIINELLDTSS